MYDVVIIGGGAAGLAAAMYSGRYLLKTLVLAERLGGTFLDAHVMENVPGFTAITGFELKEKYEEHARKFGAEIKNENVKNVKKAEQGFIVETDKESYEGKILILAVGMEHRKLEIPGEEDFVGKGVSYCATCDAAFYKDKIVGVIGGSDAAGTGALLCAEYAKKVYIIYRKDKLRAEPVNLNRIEQNPKIEIIYNTNVKEILGEGVVKRIILDNEYKGSEELELDGVFVEIGSIPRQELVKDLGLETDERGFVKVDRYQRTNIDGVYVAGDITNNNFKQVITAASEGSVAAYSAYQKLKEGKIRYD